MPHTSSIPQLILALSLLCSSVASAKLIPPAIGNEANEPEVLTSAGEELVPSESLNTALALPVKTSELEEGHEYPLAPIKAPLALLNDPFFWAYHDTMDFMTWSPLAISREVTPSFVLPAQRSVAAAEDVPYSLFTDIKLDMTKAALLARYREALKLSNQEACPEFLSLRDEKDFSLAPMAKLRAWMLCPTQVPKGETLEDVTELELQSLKLDAEMIHAERSDDWVRHLTLLQSKIAGMKSLREKTKALESALQTAEFKAQAEFATKFRNELERLAPRFIKNPKPADFLSVGQDLIQSRGFDKGRGYLRKVLASGQSLQQKRRAFQSIRNSYKVEQDKKTHLVEAEKYFKYLNDQKEVRLAYEAGIYWIRALWTEGQKAKAEKELEKLEKNFAKKTHIYDIEFIRGKMSEEEANYTAALKHYDRALELGGRGSAHEIRLESGKAWALRQLGRHQEAANEFAAVAKLASDPPDRLRSLFWQGKSLIKAGKPDEAKLVFRQVAFDDPIGYYGLVAFHELSSSIPPLAQPRSESLKGWDAMALAELDAPTPSGKPAAPNAVASIAPVSAQVKKTGPSRTLTEIEKIRISDLNYVGEKEILQVYLDKISEDAGWVWTSSEGLSLLRSYASAGLYLPLFATMGKIESSQREEILLAHPELLFPRDFQALITEASEKEGIPKELPFSIIRQESAFNPKARSFADAMGLMQVMPDQAKKVAAQLKMPFKGHDDLYTPEINIPIGVRMLRQGMDKYKNNFILAIASYNANDRAIKGWLKTRFRDDPVEFIEEIAYDETRGYVKLVLRNYIFYKRLENPTLALAFPEECLPGLQNFKDSGAKEVVSR